MKTLILFIASFLFIQNAQAVMPPYKRLCGLTMSSFFLESNFDVDDRLGMSYIKETTSFKGKPLSDNDAVKVQVFVLNRPGRIGTGAYMYATSLFMFSQEIFHPRTIEESVELMEMLDLYKRSVLKGYNNFLWRDIRFVASNLKEGVVVQSSNAKEQLLLYAVVLGEASRQSQISFRERDDDFIKNEDQFHHALYTVVTNIEALYRHKGKLEAMDVIAQYREVHFLEQFEKGLVEGVQVKTANSTERTKLFITILDISGRTKKPFSEIIDALQKWSASRGYPLTPTEIKEFYN